MFHHQEPFGEVFEEEVFGSTSSAIFSVEIFPLTLGHTYPCFENPKVSSKIYLWKGLRSPRVMLRK